MTDHYTVEIHYPSQDGVSEINAQIWTRADFGAPEAPGAAKPKGVIQIVHGMSEYIERYDSLAAWLVDSGYIVCAEDHIGHGKTVSDPSGYGHMPVEGGKEILLADVDGLRAIVSGLYPDLPYIMYGHSMGSFITRAYIAWKGQGLSAVVLSGTGNMPALVSQFGQALAKAFARFKGERDHEHLLDYLTLGRYATAIQDAKTPMDWLTTDPDVVQAYLDDAQSGFSFTAGGYATLLSLTSEVVRPSNVAKIPKGLPILLISGEQDPVGDMGRGVFDAYKLMRDAGIKDVDIRIYSGLRHELHNEVGKERIFEDVVTWLNERVTPSNPS